MIDRNYPTLRKIADDAGVHPVFLEGFIDAEVIEHRCALYTHIHTDVELVTQISLTAWQWTDWDDDADMTNCLRLRAWSMKVAAIGFDAYVGQRDTYLMGFEKQIPQL